MGCLEPHYVCVYVPEFPAQARLRLRPEQARTGVVILEGEAPFQAVCSATKEARRLGATVGMTRSQLEAVPGIVALLRSPVEERTAQDALLSTVGAFTPRVERVPSDNCFVSVLDMAGSRLLFGGVRESTKSIAHAVRRLGLRAQLAVSSNFHAALCSAPYARRHPLILLHGREHELLGSLPVTALRLNPNLAATLDLWGVRTLAELAALPETELVVRFGQEGKRLRSLALGEYAHLMVPEEPSFVLEEILEFDAPEDRLEALLFVAGPMIDQLIARAQTRAMALASITIELRLQQQQHDVVHASTLKPSLPLDDRSMFLKLMNLNLQTHPPSAAVTGIRLTAQAGKRGNVQKGLFSPQLPEPTRLDVTLAQVEAMVGGGCAGSPRLVDTHRPDSFTIERFTPPAKPSGTSRPPLSAALRRMRPPLRLRVRVDSATRRPRFFYFESRLYTVIAAYGPWRQSGEWWSERVWSHDEWDIHAECGEDMLLCVLAHDLLHEFWRIEAFYD